MKKTVLFLFCCFALSLCCFSQGDDCETMYQSAIDYYNKGDYENALSRFRRVVSTCGEGGDYRGSAARIQEIQRILDNANGPSKSGGISVNTSSVSFGPQGGEETVRVTSEATWTWGRVPEWFKLSKSKGRLVINCTGNTSGEDRSAYITLYSGEGADRVSKKIQVTQSKSYLTVGETEISLPAYGGSSSIIQVESNDEWSVVVSRDSWFQVTKLSGGVYVSCTENPMAERRRGTFDIVTSNSESVTISVEQRKSSPKLEMDTLIKVPWNVSSRVIAINTNVPNWTVRLIGGSWCRPEKINEQELLINFDDNDSGYARDAIIRVTADNISQDITITQRTLGYASLYEDYFVNAGGTRRMTKFSASVYGIGSWGLRLSGFMFRWRVVEIDLLNLNASVSKSFHLSWEPMVRGYLPLQSDGCRWTAYVGAGGCVTFLDKPLKEGNKLEHSKYVLEAGAECKLKLKNFDKISTRIFVRFDGYASLGVAFDLFEWK